MKTETQLSDLLKAITPLPWNAETPFAANGSQYWADQAYRHHAANALPEVVKALTRITNGNDLATVQEWAHDALLLAQTIKEK